MLMTVGRYLLGGYHRVLLSHSNRPLTESNAPRDSLATKLVTLSATMMCAS